jgi:hypothetical protein
MELIRRSFEKSLSDLEENLSEALPPRERETIVEPLTKHFRRQYTVEEITLELDRSEAMQLGLVRLRESLARLRQEGLARALHSVK